MKQNANEAGQSLGSKFHQKQLVSCDQMHLTNGMVKDVMAGFMVSTYPSEKS